MSDTWRAQVLATAERHRVRPIWQVAHLSLWHLEWRWVLATETKEGCRVTRAEIRTEAGAVSESFYLTEDMTPECVEALVKERVDALRLAEALDSLLVKVPNA